MADAWPVWPVGVEDMPSFVGDGVSRELSTGDDLHAYIWRDGIMSDLDEMVTDLPWRFSARGINDDGYIIGGAWIDGVKHAFLLTPIATCPWDFDDNGSVGTSDLLELFSQWGTAGTADFDESGAVGTADLLILFANWGPCP